MNTKTRYRQAYDKVEITKVFSGFTDHHNYWCLDNIFVDDSRDLSIPLLTEWSEKSITDTVIDLDGLSSAERNALFRSNEYKAWKCATFKDVNNFEVNVRLVEEPDDWVFEESKYNTCAIGAYSYANWSGTGASSSWSKNVREPVTFLLQDPDFQDQTGVAPTDFTAFIDYASSDAALLGSESFSIANFLAELKELHMLQKLFKFKWADEPLRTAAEVNLGWNFGIAPMISDIIAMYDIAMSLQERIDKWNSMADAGVLMNKHARSRGNLGPFQFEKGYQDAWGSWVSGKVTADVKSFSTYYHLYYHPVRIPDLNIKDIYFSVLGLRNPAEIVWEGIPFSFLVDWVYNVGDIISLWTNAEPVIQMDIVTFGYSRKLDMAVTSTAHRYRGDFVFTARVPINVSCGRYEGTYTAYERKKLLVESLPEQTARSVGEWQLADIGLKKASLLASLAIVLS